MRDLVKNNVMSGPKFLKAYTLQIRFTIYNKNIISKSRKYYLLLKIAHYYISIIHETASFNIVTS